MSSSWQKKVFRNINLRHRIQSVSHRSSAKKLDQLVRNDDFILCLHNLDWIGVGGEAYAEPVEEEVV